MCRKWEPSNFDLKATSIWSFPDRGSWATHSGEWRGNWSPYIPRNVILRYSREGDLVLDQFAGGGTTLIEAKLLNRNIVGVDINEKAIRSCKIKTNFELRDRKLGKVSIIKGDARSLNFINDCSIDLICTHPPYADIIRYSDGLTGDLSLLNVGDFNNQISLVAKECLRVLKKNKYCAILIGDARKNGFIEPISFNLMNTFMSVGFKLKEIIIKEQHNCRNTEKWIETSKKRNFLMIKHEFLFIFKKD